MEKDLPFWYQAKVKNILNNLLKKFEINIKLAGDDDSIVKQVNNLY